MATINDVAKKSGYSKSTVSKALNGYTDIGDEAKKKILQVASEMGYLSNYHARVLKTKETFSIGVVYVDEGHNGLKNDFFAWLIHNFREGIEAKGYDLTFINLSSEDVKRNYIEYVRYRGFDGVCIICANELDQEIIKLSQTDLFPVVVIDMDFEGARVIKSDNYGGMRMLLEYIISNNHKKIAYITGQAGQVTNSRLKAYYDVMSENNIDIQNEYLIKSFYRDPDDTETQVMKLLKLKDRPTCILVPDDFALLGAVKAIENSGLRYPEDVSLAGYDGIPISKIVSPKMTTIEQDCYRLGITAADELLNAIEGDKKTDDKITMIEGKLIKGESVYKLTK